MAITKWHSIADFFQEFSWADQAFSTLSKFHGEVAAELIDEKFKASIQM